MSALAAIHTAFARAVEWRQDGQNALNCTAVKFTPRAEHLPFSDGGSLASRGYEVPQTSLPFRPRRGDTITDAGTTWRIIQVQEYDIAEAWRVHVERA